VRGQEGFGLRGKAEDGGIVAAMGRTHDLGEDLSEDPGELLVNKRAALETGLLEPLDLLLHDNLESGRANKE
jgi:hypothetical protein